MKRQIEDKIRYFENLRIRAIERGRDPVEMSMIKRGLENCYKEQGKGNEWERRFENLQENWKGDEL
jgi:lipopolysaccharide biosynthesis regulator YciM